MMRRNQTGDGGGKSIPGRGTSMAQCVGEGQEAWRLQRMPRPLHALVLCLRHSCRGLWRLN